jgi:enterochelin esterase-like enzyme
MPSNTPFSKRQSRSPLLFGLSLVLALICGLLLFHELPFGQLTSALISLGLDPSRSQFLAALILTLAAALPAAALGRHRLAALLGSALIFCSQFLRSFLQLQLQPHSDPGGRLQSFNATTLLSVLILMLALALLSALLGAASGIAIGEILLDPPSRLLRWLWQARRPSALCQHQPPPSPRSTTMNILCWLQAALLLILLILATQSSSLFLFSPDVGIHTTPNIIKHQKGTLKQDSFISTSLHNQRRSFVVYLPPSYTSQPAQRYPVLYLLHGAPGGERDWFTGGKAHESADTLIETQHLRELILVSPDGNGRPGLASEWGNSYDQSQLIETFLARDLVAYVDQHYRTLADPAHRAIAGLSMGGFGAMNIALHHPSVFATVISLGGYYQAKGEIWGHNPSYLQHNSPALVLPHLPQAHKLHFFLGAATKDQPYYDYAKQFIQVLASLQIPYQLDLQDGHHSWRVWQVQMYHALLWMTWS